MESSQNRGALITAPLRLPARHLPECNGFLLRLLDLGAREDRSRGERSIPRLFWSDTMEGLDGLHLASPQTSSLRPNAFTPQKCADELLLSPADPNLRCSVCHQIFTQPQRTACGHVFCRDCLQSWLSVKQSCPDCRAPVKLDAPTPDRLAEGLVSNLQGFCQMRSSGCCWVGKRGDMTSHLANDCQCVVVFCPNEGCNTEMRRHELESHLQLCTCAPVLQVECPYGCGTHVAAGPALDEHRAACLLEPRKLLAAIRQVRRSPPSHARKRAYAASRELRFTRAARFFWSFSWPARSVIRLSHTPLRVRAAHGGEPEARH